MYLVEKIVHDWGLVTFYTSDDRRRRRNIGQRSIQFVRAVKILHDLVQFAKSFFAPPRVFHHALLRSPGVASQLLEIELKSVASIVV